MRRLFQFATAPRPRVHAAAESPCAVPEGNLSVYIYGVARRDGMVKSAAPFIEGVIPGVPVELLSSNGYAVIVSRAPSQLFNPAVLPAGGRAAAHHRALINLAMFADIAPVSAGFVLPDSEAVADWLRRAGASVSRALDRAGGSQEWGVRLFADMERCVKAPVTNPAITALEAGLHAASPSKALAIRKKLLEECSREVLRNLGIRAEAVHRRLLDRAREGIANPLVIGASWNGVAPILALDSAYLVARGQDASFNRYVMDLTDKLNADGFALELSGPWPPYSFAPINLKTPDAVQFG